MGTDGKGYHFLIPEIQDLLLEMVSSEVNASFL